MHSLKFQWLLPGVHQHYHAKPLHFLAHLLGHEGTGSLFSQLRRRNWATSLGAYPELKTESFSFFALDITLSEAGLANIEEVIAAVYRYIGMLARADEQQLKELYEEEASLSELKFRFHEKVCLPHTHFFPLLS